MTELSKDEGLIQRVRAMLQESPLIDGHNDMPWRYLSGYDGNPEALDFSSDTSLGCPRLQTDIPRLRAGCVGAQFWAVYIPDDWAGKGADGAAVRMMEFVRRMVSLHPAHLEMAYSARDIRRIHAAGRIACLIGVEGAHTLEGSLERLEEFYRIGDRYMTLACSQSNGFADSATGSRIHGGLSPLGKELVHAMNRLGMLVDLSHASVETMADALEAAGAPVIFSHSCARALCDTPRNVPDDVLRRVAKNGGVVMVAFVPMFLRKTDGDAPLNGVEDRTPVSLSDVADHIDHVRDVAGIDHVGIGSDFGGFQTAPEGLSDVSAFPALLAELLRRGYSETDLKKVAGENILRVFESA